MTALPRYARNVALSVMILLGPTVAQQLHAQEGHDTTVVLGTLYRETSLGRFALPGMKVTISNPQIGRSYPAYSDGSGRFALYNVPPGAYTLEVWMGAAGAPPFALTVNVSPQPQEDLGSIVVGSHGQ
jgi:carboxypeptidase family protein